MASIRTLSRLIEERDYIVLHLVESQMVGSSQRERYWKMQFNEVTEQIDALCGELGLPHVDTVQLPLFVFLDDEVTNVTFK